MEQPIDTRLDDVPADTRAHKPLPAWAIPLLLLPLLPIATLDLPPGGDVLLSLALLLMGLVFLLFFPGLRLGLAAIGVVASARYLWWRATQTLVFDTTLDAVASVALLGAEAYGLFILVGGFFQTVAWRERTPEPLPLDPDDLPTVDVFVTCYNEPIPVIRRTLVGAMAIDYPRKRVYLLDDGRRADTRALAAEVGCDYLTRPDNRGAKAGNLNDALRRTHGQLVAVFDADHVPVEDFLENTVGFFLDDPKCALVQTPHHFYNPDPFERNLHAEGRTPPEQAFFYHRIQCGNDFWNSAFFCGSCAVLRRDALLGVGGIAQETVTEDAHTALKLHAAGWRSVYVDRPMAAGLATERLAFHIGQRIRWARGMTQILRVDTPFLKRGLTLAQRFNYTISAAHFLFGLPRLVFLLGPPAFLVFGVQVLHANLQEMVLFAAPHLLLSYTSAAVAHRNTRHSFWAEVYETAVAPTTAVVTTLAMFSPRHGKFNVTPKGAVTSDWEFDFRSTWPLMVILALTLVGMLMIPARLMVIGTSWDTVLLAGMWNLWNVFILFPAIAAANERPERRTQFRIECRGKAYVVASDGTRVAGDLVDLSEGGICFDAPRGLAPGTRVVMAIEAKHASVANLVGVVRKVRPIGDVAQLSVQFDAPTPAQVHGLIRVMFCAPDQWTRDLYRSDEPISAMFGLFTGAVWSIVGRVSNRTRNQERQGAALMTEGRAGDFESTRRSVLVLALGGLGFISLANWEPVVAPFLREVASPTRVALGARVYEEQLVTQRDEYAELLRTAELANTPLFPDLSPSWQRQRYALRQRTLERRVDAKRSPDGTRWVAAEGAVDRLEAAVDSVGEAFDKRLPRAERATRLRDARQALIDLNLNPT